MAAQVRLAVIAKTLHEHKLVIEACHYGISPALKGIGRHGSQFGTAGTERTDNIGATKIIIG